MKKYFILGLIFCFSPLFVASAQYIPQPPYQVQNVKASAGDNSISITWDETSDQDGGVVIGYKIYYGTLSVTPENKNQYDDEILMQDPITQYIISDVPAGTYYLAVTAIDDEQGESRNYSQEVSVTVGKDNKNTTLDTGTPKVRDVEQVSKNQVQVLLSEEVVLTNTDQSFIVQNLSKPQDIVLSDFVVNSNIVTLTLSSDLQTGDTYQVMATSAVEDLEGNPVASGITDTVQFVAEDLAFLDSLEASNTTSSEATPSPTAVEPPREPLSQENTQLPQEIDSFGPHLSAQQREGLTLNESISDEISAPIEVIDSTPPQDVSQIFVNTDTVFLEQYVTITWEKTIDQDSDIADQILYVKAENGDWDNGYSLGKDTEKIELNVDLDIKYEIKLVTVDLAGNASTGTLLEFSTVQDLPQSGAASYSLIFILLIAGFFGYTFYKKQKRLY